MAIGTLICRSCGVRLTDADTAPCSTPDCDIITRVAAIRDWEALRTEAMKRITEQFHTNRRRTKERLRWLRENPSPRTAEEKMNNLRAALLETAP